MHQHASPPDSGHLKHGARLTVVAGLKPQGGSPSGHSKAARQS
ncbi:MAG: hypothetical protein WAW75_10135 [Gallionella sp.]